MAKRALFSRLSRLELPGWKPKDASARAVKHQLASLELKVDGETRRVPSPKAVQEEKVQLEKIRKVETRERALRLIEKFREKERLDRADLSDRNWRSEESDRTWRSEEVIRKIDGGWKIARIALRLVFGLALLYFGLRGVFNLINLIRHPVPNLRTPTIDAIWVGVAFVVLGWIVQSTRRRLLAYEGFAWVPYARTVCLAWLPLVGMTATLFLGRLLNPSAETFLRMFYVYLYVTLLACWFYFLTVV